MGSRIGMEVEKIEKSVVSRSEKYNPKMIV